MKINLKKAVKTFYPNPSFEQVYFEAIANSLDAGADEIKILIQMDSYDKPDTLKITIKDNGRGFTDDDFSKFSSLLEVDSADHKGLGRLVYLAYFSAIQFESCFEGAMRRTFQFDAQFSGTSEVKPHEEQSGSTITFKHFHGEKVKSYDYLVPERIKDSILKEFFPMLFARKEAGKHLSIEIALDVAKPNPDHAFVTSKAMLTLSDLPLLKQTCIQEPTLDFFQNIDIYYSASKDLRKERSIVTSICVDGRAISFDLIPVESVPQSYQVAFFFMSEFFVGKTNSSRQRLELPDEVTEKTLKAALRREAGRLIAQEIPAVVEENKKTKADLDEKFPHLAGYYPKDTPGLMVRATALEEAQRVFFAEQKKLLECETLDEARYEKALELSARALMEYVLYRARIIEKLKATNLDDSEEDIHRIIVPMKRIFHSQEWIEDSYNNNVWMLDDKYMSYDTVLSDQRMSQLLERIGGEAVQDDTRPDIAIVFSADPDKSAKVSVVIVELKKRGVELAKKEEVVSQLRQRARKLLQYYPGKIERIWFYGITDIDSEFRVSLKEDQFKELFSHGQLFYKQMPIITADENNPFYVDLFVMTFEALINDAESRNATFIRILRARIASFISDSGIIPAN